MLAVISLSVVLLSAPTPAQAAAGNSFTYAGCTVTMRSPQVSFTGRFGGTWADGRALASTSKGCGRRHEVNVCYDYQYKRNNGVLSAWQKSSPSDRFRYARNGCTTNAGATGSADAFATFGFAKISYDRGLYDAKCTKFKSVRLRTSAWVTTDNGRSAVHRSGLMAMAGC